MTEEIIQVLKEIINIRNMERKSLYKDLYNDEDISDDDPRVKQTRIQLFDCLDTAGDTKDILYQNGDVTVYYCHHWDYAEVIGLSHEDYRKVFKEVGE